MLGLSADRMRLLRFDDVRETGSSGSFSIVLLRDEGPRDEPVVRTEVDRWGSSVEDELALDAPMSDSRAPRLEGGGGGGDFKLAAVVALLAISPGVGLTPVTGTSLECCDESVREELLLERFSADECRSWLCRRAKGTGGGARFCLEFERLSGSSRLSSGGDAVLWDFPAASRGCGGCGGCGDDSTGVGGSGLLVSEMLRGLVTGDGAASVAAKLSKDTVCGCLGVTSLPWRWAGAGGGFLFDLVLSGAMTGTLSSSERAISYEVLGDSAGASCAGSSKDWRDIDDASVLLPLSTTAAVAGFGAVGGCGAWAADRGYGLPVKSMFLKLSTSSDALLLP